MNHTDDRQFPAALAAALALVLDCDYDGDGGIDFEPFPAFECADDTTSWFRAWTGNAELDGDEFRVFGQDGSGGYAAFWLVRPGRPVVEQPVVFLGSEGETGVVARDLGAFLWLLAGGYGPGEAVDPSRRREWTARPRPELLAVAEQFAGERRQSPTAVIEEAALEFPEFDDTVAELCC
ncbi:SMI1/KNR4 family protein [Kitasatospora sp. NPDC004614]|uniref:SMI1/KNR4 family protein n=1 Tax=unclassified Kitasatospora TaxID=2633591 RepID=UPI00369700E6